MVAEEFSVSKAYAIGDIVLYGGTLYRFTTAHSAGAWNSSQVAAVDTNTEQELTSIRAAYSRAQRGTAYVARIGFSPSQIIGNRYKYTLMNA